MHMLDLSRPVILMQNDMYVIRYISMHGENATSRTLVQDTVTVQHYSSSLSPLNRFSSSSLLS